MANRGHGNVKALSPARMDELFDVFYNRGQRRTYAEVETYTKENGIPDGRGLSYATIRRYADEYDWIGRADSIDIETRKIQDAKTAAMVAEQRVRHINLAANVTTRFMRRFIPSTPQSPNPFEIQPDEISLRDAAEFVRLFELLTGGATERVGGEEKTRMQEIAEAIGAMDAKELAATTTNVPALGPGKEAA